MQSVYYNNLGANKRIYDAALQCFQNRGRSFPVTGSIPAAELAIEVLNDHPEIFYVGQEFRVMSSLMRRDIMPAYLYSPAEATKIRGQLDAAAQSIISEHINDHQSDYDKVRSLHDYLKSNLEYDTVAASSHRPNERNIAEAHECPGCGEKHTNLVPSKYGILKRTCLCGTKLPTTFLNGRGQLKAYCPECDTALSGDTASRQYAFPVIGGPSVGKTCFINMAIDQMMSDVAPARSWEMSFISDTEEKDHALAMKSLNQGVRLMKTELNSLTAYQLMLKLPNEKIGRRIYVYDISGEMFSSSSDVQNNLAYSYANGFIFIIDPLTLNQFAMDVEDKVDLNAYGASSKDFDDILNIMLINLEKMFGLKDKDTLKRNLAVVINKVDIPTLEEKIGETAAQQYLAENAKTCKSYMDARDAVCRNFLEEYGAGNFVRTAEAKFKTVRYFTCSALGHNHEGQPYEGKNVVDPVMWLLQQADSSIKAE